MDLRYDTFYIGGEWARPTTDRTINPVNASTEEPLGRVPEGTEADIDKAVAAARAAFDAPSGWASWEPAQRAEMMERLAEAIDKRADGFVERVSAQNGMPVAVARQLETGYPSAVLRYYASLAREAAFEETRAGLFGGSIQVRKVPVGVVAAIVPWNFPQALTMFKIAPAMAAGCTLVIKPSPETVLDAYLLAEAVEEAGVPAGVINIVPAGREVGAYLVSHPAVDKVAFTGSTPAGRAIAETCGRLLRPVTLELGGKSAAIVLDDADLDLAKIGEGLFGFTLLNNGQTCFLGTRVLAPRSRYTEVVDAFTALAGSLTVGDASDPATQIGPMATARQRKRVESYIAKGRGEGARLTTGGSRPADLDRGWFVQPTVFADVDNASVIAQEEIFGPVLSLSPYDDVDDAVHIANDSDFGLGGAVWTSDPDRGATDRSPSAHRDDRRQPLHPRSRRPVRLASRPVAWAANWDKPAAHANLARPFLNWFLLRRARQRAAMRRHPASADRDLRRRLRVALDFLAWIDQHGLALTDLAQEHIDDRITGTTSQRRYLIRYFLKWTTSRRLTRELTVPSIPRQEPQDLLDDDDRWRLLQHCLTDDALPTDVRAGGAITLLFGPSTERLCHLTPEHLKVRRQACPPRPGPPPRPTTSTARRAPSTTCRTTRPAAAALASPPRPPVALPRHGPGLADLDARHDPETQPARHPGSHRAQRSTGRPRC